LLDSSTIRDTSRESTKVDHIVGAGGRTIGTIAAPEAGMRVEPQAGGVVIVERAESNEGG